MGRLVLVALLGAGLLGCSRDTLQRTTYETLRQYQQQQCRQQGVDNCSAGEGYDDYQQRRKELERSSQ